MERFKKYFLVTLGFAFAGAIGAAFGTGKAEAVVASLVQVANTASSPVVTLSVTDPGRLAYQSNQLPNCTASPLCDVLFPAVPSGHRVVVQHITGELATNVSATKFRVQVLGGIGHVSQFFVPVFTAGGSTSGDFDQAVVFSVDSGQQVGVLFAIDAGVFGAATVTLTGYELDCTVAACAPIATQ